MWKFPRARLLPDQKRTRYIYRTKTQMYSLIYYWSTLIHFWAHENRKLTLQSLIIISNLIKFNRADIHFFLSTRHETYRGKKPSKVIKPKRNNVAACGFSPADLLKDNILCLLYRPRTAVAKINNRTTFLALIFDEVRLSSLLALQRLRENWATCLLLFVFLFFCPSYIYWSLTEQSEDFPNTFLSSVLLAYFFLKPGNKSFQNR